MKKNIIIILIILFLEEKAFVEVFSKELTYK